MATKDAFRLKGQVKIQKNEGFLLLGIFSPRFGEFLNSILPPADESVRPPPLSEFAPAQ